MADQLIFEVFEIYCLRLSCNRPRQNYKNYYCQSDTRLQLGIRIRRAVSFGLTAEEIFLLISSTSLVHERCPSIKIEGN